VAVTAVERAVQIAPNDANVWAARAALYTDEYKHSYNARPGSLDRALEAARQAVTLEPDNAYANFVLAEVFYFRQELGSFKASAEKAIALNPYDSDAMAMTGILMGYGGDWERGVELANRAMALNPNHPGWYRFGIVFYQLRQAEYEAALETALRINLPMYFADPYVRAVAHANLGHAREAEQAAQEFLALWPEGDLNRFQTVHLDRWFYASPELSRLTLEGLELAGLDFN
jgi:tetratricopeptide (TPR) repeat protein